MKKFITYFLSIILLSTLAIGGTVAYLHDDNYDVNVMSTGSVKIDQLEFERSVDSNGKYETIIVDAMNGNNAKTYKLKEFSQDKPLYPGVYNSNEFNFDVYDATKQLWTTIGLKGASDLYDKEAKNVIDKFVFVKNVGDSDAYIRTVFAFEQASFTKDQLFNEIININRNDSQWEWENVGTVSIEGTNYYIITATYQGSNGVLSSNEVTFPSLLQVMMRNTVMNEDALQFGDEYKIYAFSQAVQTEGFGDATTALNYVFGKITTQNNPWTK